MSSSLLLQQCPICLVHLILIVFMMGGRWLYSCCFVGCCLYDLFNIACSILVYLPSSFFSIRFISVHVVHLYSSIDMTAAWKKLHFILSVRSDFHMTDSLSMPLLVRCWCLSRLMRHCFLGMWTFQLVSELLFRVQISPVWLKHIYSILRALTWRPMPAVAHSRLCSSQNFSILNNSV